MLDYLIAGGTVVDGTGAPGRKAQVGVRDGKVVAVGEVDESAARTIDASGLVVCPGFIDVHTHYDAQLTWDPYATPSCFHGVTTVIGGNCGFGVAPLAGKAADYVGPMLAVVEGIPIDALNAGLSWDWDSFGDWLHRFDRHLGVNAAFLVGHSVLRRLVMGEAAVGAEASDGQIEQMVQLLHRSLDDGGLGFSSSWAPTHVDAAGQPVPSRAASPEELVALAAAAGEHPGTTLAFIPGLAPFTELQADVMVQMSKAANRPINWNTFRVMANNRDLAEAALSSTSTAPQRGARVVALAFPGQMESFYTLVSTFPLTGLPGWSDTMQLPLAQRIVALQDPGVRERLAQGATSAKGGMATLARWGDLRIVETFAAENDQLAGRAVGEVAAARGQAAFDTLLDISLADGLRTVFRSPPAGDDPATWELRSRYWGDPRTLIGGSDAGAHLDTLCNAGYTSDFLGKSVRDRGLLPLERAVQLITDMPARLFGLDGRGRIAEGCWADLVAFDPATIRQDSLSMRTDLPGGASRLFCNAVGVRHVLVNGVEIVDGDQITGALPGTVLRSGHQVSTVTAR